MKNLYIRQFVFGTFVAALTLLSSCAEDDEILVPHYELKPKPPETDAERNPNADASFEAFNKAFLLYKNGLQYYRSTLISEEKDYFWGQALDIQMAEDVYWRTKNPTHATLISDLLNAFVKQNVGTTPPGDWGWNDFNDDILWAGLAFARGYQITDNPVFLEKAEYAFNLMYDRGWDEELGGGIWWRQLPINEDERSKSALSNSPAVILGCYLYEFTEKADYLTKSEKISTWLMNTLYRSVDGGVYENIKATGKLSDWGNVYTNGAFVEAMTHMHKLTGQNKYYDAAQNASDFVKRERTTNGIMASHRFDGTWQSEYLRGIGNFIRENNLWAPYYDWLRMNADVAWNARRKDLNLTWNDWLNPTDETDNQMKPLEALGGVIVQQITPLVNPEILVNKTYNIFPKTDTTVLFTNTNNSLTVAKTSSTNSQEFRVVSKGYGYYQVESVSNTGTVLSVDGENITFKPADAANENQFWKIVFDNRGYYKLRPKKSPLKVLNFDGTKFTLLKEKFTDGERIRFREK
ncbi:MAG: glycoside hydrolase family 76 protein [Niabella sp.]